MIVQILKKDWKLLWPMVALVTLVQLGLEACDYALSLPGGASQTATELIRPLMLVWFFAIAALTVAEVHQDPIPGTEHDWLIRPLSRTQLLLAKLIFLLVSVCLPMFVFNLGHAVAIGFAPLGAAGTVSYKALYTFVFLIVPLAALAAMTRNFAELTLLGAGLMLVYALSSAANAFLFPAGRCPTCGTGLLWIQHLWQHVELLAGSGLILGIQYYRRRTSLSRTVALAGTAVLVFIQIPWGMAFSIQQGLGASPGASRAIALQSAGAPVLTETEPGGAAPAAGRQATRALMRGDLGSAVNLLRKAPGGAAVWSIDVPLQVSGVADDELVLVDRAEAMVREDGEKIVYRRAIPDESPAALTLTSSERSEAGSTVHQRLRISSEDLPGKALGPHSRVQLQYSLTLMKVVEEHRLAALGGEFRSPAAGVCHSQLDEDNLSLACRQIGRGPYCFSAVLYGPDGAHNPQVDKCDPDYRPYMPAIHVLAYAGLTVPVRDRSGAAHYAVDASRLGQAYLVVRIYAATDHFTRTLAALPQPR